MRSSSIKEALRGKRVKIDIWIPKRWELSIIDLLDNLSKLPEWNDLVIVQIKAKFGQLRFYYDGPSIQKVDELIDEAVLFCPMVPNSYDNYIGE